MDVAVDIGVVDRRGSYYNYGETRLAQGRENAKEFLRENPDIAAEVEQEVRQELGLLAKPDDEEEPVTEELEEAEAEE